MVEKANTEICYTATSVQNLFELSNCQRQWSHMIDNPSYTSCGSSSSQMAGALDSGPSSLSQSPGQGHCDVFLCMTLCSHCAPLHQSV